MHSGSHNNSDEIALKTKKESLNNAIENLEKLIKDLKKITGVEYMQASPYHSTDSLADVEEAQEEVQIRTTLLKNLIAFHKNTREDMLAPLANIADPRDQTEIKTSLHQFSHICSQMVEASAKVFKDSREVSSEEREEMLSFITQGIDLTQRLIKKDFQDPDITNALLTLIKPFKRNKVTQLILKNPTFSTCFGFLGAALGLGLIVGGGLACLLPGGVVAGGLMIAAGTALIPIGTKMVGLGGWLGSSRDRDDVYDKKLHLAELGDALEKIANSRKTHAVFAACEQAVQALRDFFHNRVNKKSPSSSDAMDTSAAQEKIANPQKTNAVFTAYQQAVQACRYSFHKKKSSSPTAIKDTSTEIEMTSIRRSPKQS
ncbi:MAG: hypothetical protein K0R24_247 [Gammaproteobacteria bacterium]|jgi:hypothetical protein|nr:hypothetical protein [Gammaproteobacteria bacterium]